MNPLRLAALSAAAVVLVTSVRGQAPATQSGLRIERATQDVGLRLMGGGGTQVLMSGPRVTFVSPVDGALKLEFETYLRTIRATQDGRPMDFQFISLAADNVMQLGISARQSGPSNDLPQFDQADVAAALSKALKLDANQSTDRRAAETARVQAELDQVVASFNVLQAMLAVPRSDSRPLVDRLREWRAAAADLREQIQAKNVRLNALGTHRERLEARQEAVRQNDPVIVELSKIVDLRKQKLAAAEKSAAANGSSQSELTDARLAVSEAELRLAERSTSVVSSGTVASLDQLGQEIVKLSVDLDELLQKLGSTEADLAQYDLAKATTQSLTRTARLTEASADEVRGRQLADDLNRQAAELREALLRLKIVKIDPPPPN